MSMSEKTEEKFIRKFGRWILRDGSYIWQEKLERLGTETPLIIEKTPQELGYVREIDFTILFAKDFPSREELDEVERKWFAQDIHIAIRDDQTNNIWLKLEQSTQTRNSESGTVEKISKVYIHDLDVNGKHMLAPLESTANIIVTKGKPRKVTIEQAKEIAEKWTYIFGKIEEEGGSQVYRVDVASKQD